MSDFPNDTRAEQILREEVWFGATQMNVANGAAGSFMTVETFDKEIQLNLEGLSRATIETSLWSDVTVGGFAGNTQAKKNMRLSSSNTTDVIVKTNVGVTVTSTNEFLFTTNQRQKQDINPLKEGNGPVLKANTLYAIQFVNLSLRDTVINLSWFFREIDVN